MSKDGNVQKDAAETTPLLSAAAANNISKKCGHPGRDVEEVVPLQDVPFSRLVLIMCTAWTGVFLGAMDETIIATLAGPITSEFESLYLLSWLATAYLLSSAACLPVMGRLTDIFGRGPGLVLCNVLFASGNLICGLATDPHVMLVGRVIAGMGGAGQRSIANFLGSDLIPLRKRGIVQGISNAFYGSGAMLGGVFGGILNDHTALGWRLAFLIQVPLALLLAIAVIVLVKVPPKQSEQSYAARIDFLGVFMASSSIVLLLLGLNSGGNMVPWTHPLPLTAIPLSLFLLTGFVWWEQRTQQPIIPVKLVLDRTVLSSCLTSFFSDIVLMAALFYVPLYLQVLGESTTTAGLRILSSPVGECLGALGSGYIMKQTGQYIRLGPPGLSALTLGTVLLVLQSERSPAWLTSLAFFFVGAGYGAMLTTTQIPSIAAVDHSQQAVVMSTICEPPPFLQNSRSSTASLWGKGLGLYLHLL
ncbi:hypothetical protein J3459_014014 [Metarhizium acridum]|nr:hypothetical protein J3459_014014 [Metarhizium acridum]